MTILIVQGFFSFCNHKTDAHLYGKAELDFKKWYFDHYEKVDKDYYPAFEKYSPTLRVALFIEFFDSKDLRIVSQYLPEKKEWQHEINSKVLEHSPMGTRIESDIEGIEKANLIYNFKNK